LNDVSRINCGIVHRTGRRFVINDMIFNIQIDYLESTEFFAIKRQFSYLLI